MIGYPGLISRVARWIATLAGAGAIAIAPAAARTVSPSAAPVEWLRYAEATTAAIDGWLRAEDETALRLRTYLDGLRPDDGRPGPPLELKLWIDGDGTISRIDFTPFAHAEANADLRTLIVGRKPAGPPPPGMKLPIRLAIQADAPAAGGEGSDVDARRDQAGL